MRKGDDLPFFALKQVKAYQNSAFSIKISELLEKVNFFSYKFDKIIKFIVDLKKAV